MITFDADSDTTTERLDFFSEVDGDITGVVDEISASSTVYFQVAQKITSDNATVANLDQIVYLLLSDGSTNYFVGVGIANDTTFGTMGGSTTATDDSWTDFDGSTTSQSFIANTGGMISVSYTHLTLPTN